MSRRALARNIPLLIAAALVVLLAALATLQHRWIGEVSALQRHRLHAGLLAAGWRLGEDFDREVTRAWLYLHPDPRDVGDRRRNAARQYERWLAEAPYPSLIRDVFYVQRAPDGRLAAELLRADAKRFAPVPWPADLAPVERRLARGGPASHHLPVAVAEVPALLIPVPLLPPRPPADAEPEATEHLVLRLNEAAIAGEVLPALTRRHFGEGEERDYALAVVAPGEPERVIFRSDPDISAAALRAGGDASLPLLGVRPFEELRGLWPERHGARHRTGGRERHAFGPPHGRHRRHGGAWRLVLLHREGSLEQAVARYRHHNLAVSGGILALLAVTAGLMVVTTQRAQRLARQQIELVAGVTHELHTPITAIRSAGQNLADGVVAEPAQVKRYGSLIEREGERLSRMVAQMLELAGLQTGRETYTLQPTAVEEVVDGAIADCRWLLDQRQARVEKDVAPALPVVLGDPGALRRALRNLLENAAKYGGQAPWIGVRARAAGGEVELTVADRGPGIRREELSHLFEPFYRGREVAAGGIPGSGLGLSVVRRIAEAHRGRVSVESGDGRGSAFTLHLPAAPEPAG